MKVAVRNAFFAFSESFESLVDWLYLDVKGFVTIGLGDLVDPPALMAGLVFLRPDKSVATSSEIQAAWLKVKNLQSQAKAGGGTFANVTSLRATHESIAKLVDAKLGLNESILTKAFPQWEEWPANAQMATLSMAWAYGAEFTHTWPKFTAACLRRDWQEASRQCRASVAELAKQNTSFKRRNATQVALFNNAAKGGDPEVLMDTNDALIEGVDYGVLTAMLGGRILSPEEHELIVRSDPKRAAQIVYTVPN